jgi:hypothetical protein
MIGIFPRTQVNLHEITIGMLLTLVFACTCAAQNASHTSSDVHEMLITPEGFLAIDTPKGWVRSEGPALAFFLRIGDDPKTAEAWIYISSAPVGPGEEDKDLNSYIQSDISGFKERFKNGTAQKEKSIALPRVKAQGTVFTFRSAEEKNAFEQIVYIEEVHRVLILALSAKNSKALEQSLPAFWELAKSYGGSITEKP